MRSLTVEEFCDRYRVSRGTFMNMRRRGDVEVVKFGRRVLITAEQEAAFISRSAANARNESLSAG